MGSCRLSIIDLAGGDQPIENEMGTLILVANGEIYNFRELRRELEGRGHRFRTKTDVEVILHAYEEYGPDSVRRLEGMFAFALWDAAKRELFLARDRFGIKPLFYARVGPNLVFGSEIKALLASRLVDTQMDEWALNHYLTFNYIPSDRSIFRSVQSLPSASHMTVRDGRVEVQRYWKLGSGGGQEHKNGRVLADAIRSRIRAAVSRQIQSDVPIGVC
jgi:asparagine synthase (glutamine-hydrolysing)